MIYNYINRDNQKINFELLDDNKTCIMSGYNSSFIRTGESDVSALDKKNNPLRQKVFSFIDVPSGPLIALGFDLNNFLFNKNDFLDQDHKKVIQKLDIILEGIKIEYISYPIKSHPNAKENSLKEKSKTSKEE